MSEPEWEVNGAEMMAAFGVPAPAGTFSVPLALFPEWETLAVWGPVRGDSMTGDGIRDGDWVLLDDARIPRDGDITAVFIPGGQRTLKRVRHDPQGRVLVASNPDYPPQPLPPDMSTLCCGVAVGVVTRLPDGRLRAWRLDDGQALDYDPEAGNG
jgi:SOS-response transcriptional repressor LexA